MSAKIQNIKKKYVYLRAFNALRELERAVEIAQKQTIGDFQISVLGKLGNERTNGHHSSLRANMELKEYWQATLEKPSEFGWFCNPELGTLFVVGSMTSIFMHPIDGKKLGALTSGPYGILRGMGIGEKAVLDHIKKLAAGDTLLIVRGQRSDIDLLASQIDLLERAG